MTSSRTATGSGVSETVTERSAPAGAGSASTVVSSASVSSLGSGSAVGESTVLVTVFVARRAVAHREGARGRAARRHVAEHAGDDCTGRAAAARGLDGRVGRQRGGDRHAGGGVRPRVVDAEAILDRLALDDRIGVVGEGHGQVGLGRGRLAGVLAVAAATVLRVGVRRIAAAAAADEHVALAVAGAHDVVAGAGEERIRARAAVEHVAPAEADERVTAGAAGERVRAGASGRRLDAAQVVALARGAVVGAAGQRDHDARSRAA